MTRHARTALDIHQLRKTGLDHVGDRPWGTHICLFYETLQDLYDVHADYFGAGLTAGNFASGHYPTPSNVRTPPKSCANPFLISRNICGMVK